MLKYKTKDGKYTFTEMDDAEVALKIFCAAISGAATETNRDPDEIVKFARDIVDAAASDAGGWGTFRLDDGAFYIGQDLPDLVGKFQKQDQEEAKYKDDV